MQPIPTATQLEALLDDELPTPAASVKQEPTDSAECVRMANATAYAAVNSALMSMSMIEREQARAMEKEPAASKAKSDSSLSGYLLNLLWYRKGSSKDEGAGTKALSTAVTALSKLSGDPKRAPAGAPSNSIQGQAKRVDLPG